MRAAARRSLATSLAFVSNIQREAAERTEEAYCDWIRRFILFHRKRHPAEMGADEIRQFLAHPAVEANVAASTQNQVLCALLFLYRDVLRTELPYVEGIERAAGEWAWQYVFPSANLSIDPREGVTRRHYASPDGVQRA